MLNNNKIYKQQAFTLVWVMLLLMLLTFLSANLHQIYTQRVIFDQSFKSRLNSHHEVSKQLSLCENKLLVAYTKELELVEDTSQLSINHEALNNTAKILEVDKVASVEYKSKSIENDKISSLSVVSNTRVEPTHDFSGLFNVVSIQELHKSFVVTKKVLASGTNSGMSSNAVKKCFYYKFKQLALGEYFKEVNQLQIIKELDDLDLTDQSLFKTYVYASIFDPRSAQHFLLRSNYILSHEQDLKQIDQAQSFVGRQGLINLSVLD